MSARGLSSLLAGALLMQAAHDIWEYRWGWAAYNGLLALLNLFYSVR